MLVLIDNYAYFSTHSNFFAFLQQKGFKVEIKMINDFSNKLRENGEWLY